MTAILTSAKALAFASYNSSSALSFSSAPQSYRPSSASTCPLTLEMSRYNVNGYDIPIVKMMIDARRLANKLNTGISTMPGNNATATCGKVSPIMIQYAMQPPNALTGKCQSILTMLTLCGPRIWVQSWGWRSPTMPIAPPIMDSCELADEKSDIRKDTRCRGK